MGGQTRRLDVSKLAESGCSSRVCVVCLWRSSGSGSRVCPPSSWNCLQAGICFALSPPTRRSRQPKTNRPPERGRKHAAALLLPDVAHNRCRRLRRERSRPRPTCSPPAQGFIRYLYMQLARCTSSAPNPVLMSQRARARWLALVPVSCRRAFVLLNGRKRQPVVRLH